MIPSAAVSKDGIAGLRVKFGKGIAGMCALTEKLINIKNAYDPKECGYFNSTFDKKGGFITQSVLCVPIFAGRALNGTDKDDVVGVIQVINKVDRNTSMIRTFDTEDEETLKALCAELGRILKQKTLEALYYSASRAGSTSSDSKNSEMNASILGSYLTDSLLASNPTSPRPKLRSVSCNTHTTVIRFYKYSNSRLIL